MNKNIECNVKSLKDCYNCKNYNFSQEYFDKLLNKKVIKINCHDINIIFDSDLGTILY